MEKTFCQFFLEYRHNLADGTPQPSIYPNNSKNPNRVGLGKKRLFTVGDYQKENNKLNIPGAILTYPELEELGLKDLMNTQLPTKFDNIKNSGASVYVYMNPRLEIEGKVIKHSTPNK